MSPSILILREIARIEGVNSAIQNADGTRGNDQLRRSVLELEAIARDLDAVQPIEATAEIRSGFYLTLPDLDAIRHELAEISEASRAATIEPIGADERIRGHLAAVLRLLTLS